jgi:hypothetical protein
VNTERVILADQHSVFSYSATPNPDVQTRTPVRVSILYLKVRVLQKCAF